MESGKFVGVVPPLAFEKLWYPKRLMLMFDELALDLNRKLSGYESYILKKSHQEIQWLGDEGLLTTLSGLFAKESSDGEKEYHNKIGHVGSFLFPANIGKEFKNYLNS